MEENKTKKSPEVKEKGEIEEVKKPRKKRSKKFWVLAVAGFAFIIYASFTIINQSIEINSRREELKSINDQLKIVEIESNYLKKVKNYKGDDLSDYIENIAREDLDFVKNGERVFINVSGD
jgi:cell division protein DivIC